MEFKKKIHIRLCAGVVFAVLGLIIVIISNVMGGGIKNDEMINIFGMCLLVMGIARAVQNVRIIRNKSALESRKIIEQDERNILIVTKARSLALTISILLNTVVMLVLYILHQDFAAQVIAYLICAVTFIYLICYRILAKKY